MLMFNRTHYLNLVLTLCFVSGTLKGDDTVTVKDIGLVDRNVLSLTLRVGKITETAPVPYVAEEGDELVREKRTQWLVRDGETIGRVMGKKNDFVLYPESFEAPELAVEKLQEKDSFQLHVLEEDRIILPQHIYRKSLPSQVGRALNWEHFYRFDHQLFFVFEEDLALDQIYLLESHLLEGIFPIEVELNAEKSVSPAIHVNQNGFRPSDGVKVAYMSCWLGDGGGVIYDNFETFEIVDENSGDVVYHGRVRLRRQANEVEDAIGLFDYEDGEYNYSKTAVYELDFSDFDKEGAYRVRVPGLGVSYPFAIAETVWQQPLRMALRAFYYHRSGIALTEPYIEGSGFERPLCFHPDNGDVVWGSTVNLYEHFNGLGKGSFHDLAEGKTSEQVNVAGGYMDAGDWDRRIPHLEITFQLLDLFELFPDYFAAIDLNIPESDNEFPDIVDEALFNLDFYRRLQSEDGSVRGGIESAEHPNYGETSWMESLDVFAYAPDAWTNYWYIVGASKAAVVLQSLDPDLSLLYRDSALLAMEWAEAEYAARKDYYKHPWVKDMRIRAAAGLYRMTGDDGAISF